MGVNFGTKFFCGEESVKPVKNLNLKFSENDKTVICHNNPEGKAGIFLYIE